MIDVKRRREQLGLSQRELAARAHVAFRTIQLIERGRHDPRWSTLAKIAGSLGSSGKALSRALEQSLSKAGDSVANVSAQIPRREKTAWKIPLFNFVDAFRHDPGPQLIAAPPDEHLPARLQALFASTVEALCAKHGVRVPLWCGGVPALAVPWFVAGIENLKASALMESPAQFRRRNIFVLDNFLERA